jgi:large subunit ribosomal protein L35
MQKLKTKKGVSKRFKITKKGRIKYHGGGKSHLATNKKSSRIRKLKMAAMIEGSKETKYLKRMLPNG